MKIAYPISMKKIPDGILVYLPDFDANTQGDNIPHAMEMARDAIGLLCVDLEDDKKELPTPSSISELSPEKDVIITLVDVDTAEYRRKNENKVVKKNCTLPSWLNYEAERANINFSAILQTALKEVLNLNDR